MASLLKKRLLLITIVYWVFLVYIVAALVWWFIALQNLNTRMTTLRISELHRNDSGYQQRYARIINDKKRKTAQYVSEGATFLALILFGAVFMYRAVRRQFALQRQQENFMMAVTHELKTPIAVAKLNLETLQKHQLEETKKQKMLDMTVQEMDRLNALVNNVLISAQLESGRSIAKEEVDLSSLVNNALRNFARRFPGSAIEKNVTDGLVVTGDPLLLEILLNNLLENAVKYSPARSTIGCALVSEHHQIILRVADNGYGIPISEREKIFRKFYRIGNEETRSAKGTGLGLYLCKKIAQDHGATIRIEDNNSAGSVFIVKFPQPGISS